MTLKIQKSIFFLAELLVKSMFFFYLNYDKCSKDVCLYTSALFIFQSKEMFNFPLSVQLNVFNLSTV